jgi:hypothetical protein
VVITISLISHCEAVPSTAVAIAVPIICHCEGAVYATAAITFMVFPFLLSSNGGSIEGGHPTLSKTEIASSLRYAPFLATMEWKYHCEEELFIFFDSKPRAEGVGSGNHHFPHQSLRGRAFYGRGNLAVELRDCFVTPLRSVPRNDMIKNLQHFCKFKDTLYK